MAGSDGVSSRRRRWFWVALVALLAVSSGLVAARVLGGRAGARAQLAEAAGLLSQAEPAVRAVDQAVRSEVTTATAETAQAALERIEPAIETLERARAVVKGTRPRLAQSDVPMADALDEAASARIEMLERATRVLQADIAVAHALGPATEAWALVGSAEKSADEAVAAFNKHTKEGVQRSTQLAGEADQMLAEARSLLETVAAGVPEADMTPFIAFIDAKRALLAESKRIDAAWLSGKIADANAMLGAYNAKEKEVAKQAERLPGTPASVLADAYKRIVEGDVAAYYEARERARSADVRLKSLESE